MTNRSRHPRRDTAAAIHEVLFPGGDLDHEWSPDTIEALHRVLSHRKDPLARAAKRALLHRETSAADALDEVLRVLELHQKGCR